MTESGGKFITAENSQRVGSSVSRHTEVAKYERYKYKNTITKYKHTNKK